MKRKERVLGIPTVIALNKSDINEKKEAVIDVKRLSDKLGCPVIETVSITNNDNGLEKVVKAAVSQRGKGQKAPYSQGMVDLQNKEAVQEASG